ncbi:MAG: glutaredoxin domain-containing protein [Candidatus Saccharimonadales bacterium]
MDSKVIVYSAVWCGFCHMAKEYFKKLGVAFEEKDIETDPKFAQESIDKSGQMGIPVIDIDGKIIIGFDRPKIDEALKAANLIK